MGIRAHFWRKILWLIFLIIFGICRFCNVNEETIIHILCKCRSLRGQRVKHFDEDYLNDEDINKQHYQDIIGFIKDIGILA